jgi:hypothetical protein
MLDLEVLHLLLGHLLLLVVGFRALLDVVVAWLGWQLLLLLPL